MIIGIVGFFFVQFFSGGISETDLLNGKTLNVGADNAVKLEIDGEDYEISVSSINDDSIDFLFYGNETENIRINETKKLDLDRDGVLDIEIKLIALENGKVRLFLKKIEESSSVEKSVIIQGGESPSECEWSSNCTEICEGCKEETQMCEQSSEICIDCIGDFNCIDGYECENNICVIEEQEEEPEEEIANYSVTDPKTILDCYSANISEVLCSPEDAYEFTIVFGERLGSCEISEGTFALGLEPFFGIFRGYKIQGEQGGNCTIKFWFLENDLINSSLLGKEMICTYDSSKRTTQDVNDCFEECCSGDLVDAIQIYMSQ